MTEIKNDWLTVGAVGLLAMCVVTCDHEALGHGSVCLLLGGHIRLLTSSLFRCDLRSGWIDPAGPASNFLMGALALVCLRFVPARLLALKLFLILVTAFSWFWEGGYVMRAMHRREGDLYFFLQFLLGDVSLWERWAAATVGLVLYVFTARVTSQEFLNIWPRASVARSVARIAWLSATVGSALAALAYTGHDWGNFRDSVLEIGAASFLLLLIPFTSRTAGAIQPPRFLARSTITVVLSVVVYAAFVVSLGRGFVS